MTILLRGKVFKLGNSHAIIVPKPALQTLKWEEGTHILIDIQENTLKVTRDTSAA